MDDVLPSLDDLSRHSYIGCHTRIISLSEVHLPASATDEEYVQIYQRYTQTTPSANARNLRDAIESIRHGIAPPVAFPTETVYGLGADATNSASVSGIFAAKGRPSDNPLIVHVSSMSHLERVTDQSVPEIYKLLLERFWPGPLTILLPAPTSSVFAKNVHPGQPTIGFRMPSSSSARFFIAAADRPIAGPSANSSGKPSPTTAQHVMDDLKGKINFILDGGSCDVGVESTVVDGLHDPPLILRPGGISHQELLDFGKLHNNKWAETAIGYKVDVGQRLVNGDSTISGSESMHELTIDGAPRAPGMKYRHYAPDGRLILFAPAAVKRGMLQRYINDIIMADSGNSLKIGFISRYWTEFAGLNVNNVSSTGSTTGNHHDQKPLTSPAEVNDLAYTRLLQSATFQNPSANGDGQHVIHRLFNIQIGIDLTLLAQSLFGMLRLFDRLKCDYIFAETLENPEPGGNTDYVFDAVADRLNKAAAERVV